MPQPTRTTFGRIARPRFGRIALPRRLPHGVRRTGTWGVNQPKFSAIMTAFRNIALHSMAKFPVGNILELPSRTILDEAKARLDSLGVADFNTVGDINLANDLVVDRPGMIGPRRFIKAIVPVLRRTHPHTVARRVGPAHAHRTLLFATINPTWPQTESVIIADELDLRNKTITIMRDKVSHLWIIARRIKANSGARITYAPLSNSGIGNAGTNGSPSPGRPNYNRYARQSSSGHHAHNGGNGNHGSDGDTSLKSKNAPDLTICVLEIDAMPDIVLQGQKGARGGTGGRGANGGNGQRGRDSKVVYAWRVPVNCSHGPGWGGNGGLGGDGGRGGRGGNAGDGANVKIATLEEKITPLVTAQSFIINIAGGDGGDNGFQGAPGEGGKGGKYGHRTGWPCNNETHRWGDDGRSGRRWGDLGSGSDGNTRTLSYDIITRAEWNEKLEQPWILSLEPTIGFAGDQVIAHGLHFVKRSKVLIHGRTVAANFDNAEKLSFNVPQDIGGGEHSVKVRTPDGDESNEVPFSVRPYLMEIRRASSVVNSISAGDEITLVGRSFVSGAGVYANGEILQTTSLTQSEIILRIPEVIGEDAGGEMRFVVHNPDRLESDELTIKRLPSLDSGFRAGVHGYAFKNFSKGRGTWGDFLKTFGSGEIAGDLILHPILTGAYYLFFEWFLSGGGAHCAGLAATALKKYHQGVTNLFSQGPISSANPPPLSSALMHELDVAQGRMLSEELITHYADQGQEAIDRVESTIRNIEQDILDGMGENSARVMCFIPSGNAWDVFSDPAYRDAFINSHSLVPTRITYPDAARSLNGAKMYVYDSNEPGLDIKCLDLFEQGGKIHFNYTGGGHNFSSTTGFTLGTAKLKKQLLDDVDMPFSGASASVALMAFVVDLILSPARISIEDGNGKVLGYKGGKMHSYPSLGYVCPWLENLILVRDDVEVTRKLIGHANGIYTYASIHPAGKSIVIKDASCSANSQDVVSINQDFSSVDIKTNEAKTLDMHIGEKLDDGTVRYVNIAHDIGANETTRLKMSPGMDGVKVHTPNRTIKVTINTLLFDGVTLVEERRLKVNVPSGKRLELPVGMWSDLAGYGPSIR